MGPWIGHVQRSSDVMKDTLNRKVRVPLGRKRWINEPNRNFGILGVENPEELANYTEEWRKLRGPVKDSNGQWPVEAKE